MLQGQGVAQAKGRAADHQDRVWMGQEGLLAQLFAEVSSRIDDHDPDLTLAGLRLLFERNSRT